MDIEDGGESPCALNTVLVYRCTRYSCTIWLLNGLYHMVSRVNDVLPRALPLQ